MTTLQQLIDAVMQANLDPHDVEICTYANENAADEAELTDIDFRHTLPTGNPRDGILGDPVIVLVTTGEFMHLAEVLDEEIEDPMNSDPAYLAHLAEQEKLCHATYTTSGVDPYGTECELEKHGVDVAHVGPDPMGGEGKITWRGGGSAGGDALPYHDVKVIEPMTVVGYNDEPRELTYDEAEAAGLDARFPYTEDDVPPGTFPNDHGFK